MKQISKLLSALSAKPLMLLSLFALLPTLVSAQSSNIEFADATVKSICVSYFDDNGDGELSYNEAAAVTNLGTIFSNKKITSFDELQYFTGLKRIGSSAFYYCNKLTTITIPNSVTSIERLAFYYCESLTSLTIPNSVTTIGEKAFHNCKRLTNLTIPNSVTAIGNLAFYWCKGLTAVTIPNSVTSIGDNPFASCSNLTSITVESGNPNYDSRDNCNAIFDTNTNTLISGCKKTVIPNSVISIGNNAFDGCTGLTTVTIPNSVTSIGEESFYNCTGLTSVIIPNSVTILGNDAFAYCTGITSVTIPISVTNIGDNPFSGCAGLTSIKVESGNTYYDSRNDCNAIIETNTNKLVSGCMNTIIPNSVTTIGILAFDSCTGLTSLTIPNSVTTIGKYAFQGCVGLTSLTIPNSVTTIENYAFWACEGLTEVRSMITEPFEIDPECWQYVNRNEIPLYVPAGTKEKYEATAGWNKFKNIVEMEAPSGNIDFADPAVKALCVANWDTDGDGELSYAEAAAVTDIGTGFANNKDITSFDELQYFTGVTELSEAAFAFSSNLQSITIPKSVTNIGRLLLIDCENLISIRVDEENSSYDSRDNCNAIIETASNRLISGCMNTVISNSVESIGDCSFEGHSGLLSITIPNTVKAIEFGAFNSCSGLSSITIPKSVTYIGVSAFANCSGLNTIQVENGNPAYDSRNNCNAIISTNGNALIAGCMSTVIPNTVTSIESFAFCGCTGLISLDIPNSVTSIGYLAFSSCSNLSSVTIPNSVTTIDDAAFQVCSSLTSLEIPNSVTTIGSSAFTCCTSLSSITIPESVTNIGDGAFSCCESMEKVFSYIKEPFEIASDAFSTDWEKNTATLYVPLGCKEIYENTAGWNTFANIVEMGIEPVDQGETIDIGNEIDESTNLDGNVVGDIYYSISSGNGSYNAAEGCLVVTKPTDDSAIDGQDIFGEDFKDNYTGIVFKLAPGKGTIKVEAETQGDMMLKVKIGNNDPIEMELNGKLKVKFPYNVSEPTYVYIYGGLSDAAGAKAMGAKRAKTLPDLLKLYSFEITSDQSGIEAVENGQQTNAEAPVYNLNGQRVSKAAKGVFIKNGRKVIVK